ncbi:MAG: pilus (MSHA type) biogenesis protein MshL [Nitrospirae bacterium]|nr:pilus (MSHA type) biogenesis protein MshL [Nitrospirota bacterium]
MKNIFLVVAAISLMSCASMQGADILNGRSEAAPVKNEILMESGVQEPLSSGQQGIEIPEFVPVQEGLSPLQTRTVSIAARKTPLREVLYIIAETANLNLVMGRDVDPELPVTLTIKDITVDNALNIIFDSVDYFYSINDNILIVKAVDTEIFELGKPNIVQDYKIDVGGDILSGTASGGAGSTSVSGDVSMKSSSDEASFKFWDSMEKTMTTLLTASSGTGQASVANFIINRMAGTIMVTATKKDLKKVGDYISNLKRVLNRQVLIEARIVEVQLSEGLKYGIDWEAVGSMLPNGTTNVGLSAKNFTNIFTSGGASFDINILHKDNFTMLIKALQEQGNVKTLSNPRVNIMNAQTSILSVGRNTTFISRVQTTTTTSEGSAPVTTFTVDTNSILSGVMFGLVPFINSDNEITLSITPIVTNLVSLDSKTIGTGDNSVEIKLPTVDLREMSTTVKVLDGQIVIIGGLIDRQDVVKENQLPLLGDIPIIGAAFKSYEKTHESTELVIMLIPRVIS